MPKAEKSVKSTPRLKTKAVALPSADSVGSVPSSV